jgi:signal transduction histidine kinase
VEELTRARSGGRWPLLPVAPALVALIGVATAVTIAFVAAQQLQRMSDENAAARSKALAAALAARMRGVPNDERDEVLAHAAERTGAAFALVDWAGGVVSHSSIAEADRRQIGDLLERPAGEAHLTTGRMRFTASTLSPPHEDFSLVAFVSAPSPATGLVRLSNAVGVLTLLLLGVAITVTLVFTKSARDDVGFVGQRIAEMAKSGGAEKSGVASAGPVPLVSLDQVGLLTAALNTLIERFAAAERSYLADLGAAAQLDAERSQFLAGLSHELRTPLNAILGFTHLLESEDEGPLTFEAREALATIRTSGEHLKALIDDILDLSAMETGQVRLSRTVVDVFALAEEVVREARATVKRRPVALSVTGDRAVFAWADPRRMRQVFTNLVSNAVNATAEGSVRVTVRKDGDRALVEIADSGRGIAPEVLTTIFEPYKQAGDEVARRGGAGLGLAITRRLVLLHGGTIEARSELGRGSCFTLRIPDETHSARVPRDSLVPFSESGDLEERR